MSPGPSVPTPVAGERRATRSWWRRHPVLAAAAVAVLAATAVVGALVGVAVSGAPGEPAAGLPPATTPVIRTDLVATEQVGGTLSYGVPTGLIATAGSGTLTWVAPAGATIALGQPVLAVDDDPVVLIHGTVPPYRDLRTGDSGTDVAQLETSLAALGYTGFTVDDAFTAETAAAVERWQADLGVPVTGSVAGYRIVVAPGDIRIAVQLLPVGTQLGTEPNQTVLTYSDTTREVTVPLDVADQNLVAVGGQATVTLPGGAQVAGTVAHIGTAAQSEDPGSGSAPGPGDAGTTTSITVVVEIPDQQALGSLDAAPVGVTLVTGERDGVLAVPVTALVALVDGGYGVQVVDGDDVRNVPVQTGLFAAGKVEISGEGITETTVVGVSA